MTDKEFILGLGGASKVAELLKYDKRRGGVQRVHNWMTRGIPAHVILNNPKVFRGYRKATKETA